MNNQIPKYLYHATYKPLLKSIMNNGLGNTSNIFWEDSNPNTVYLAFNPDQAESYAEISPLIPESWDSQIVILKIDTTNLNPLLFHIDENNLSKDTLEYRGIIPSTNITILDK